MFAKFVIYDCLNNKKISNKNATIAECSPAHRNILFEGSRFNYQKMNILDFNIKSYNHEFPIAPFTQWHSDHHNFSCNCKVNSDHHSDECPFQYIEVIVLEVYNDIGECTGIHVVSGDVSLYITNENGKTVDSLKIVQYTNDYKVNIYDGGYHKIVIENQQTDISI